ncbi:hypothetical protein ACO0M4_40720 [Streptomyces sp. RGM 3693]|uniref:hypothetical protein n=1 Tax=Streptomyces sp. RGM 3693 TaxID=3413284 RepID=UPI003D2B8624
MRIPSPPGLQPASKRPTAATPAVAAPPLVKPLLVRLLVGLYLDNPLLLTVPLAQSPILFPPAARPLLYLRLSRAKL